MRITNALETEIADIQDDLVAHNRTQPQSARQAGRPDVTSWASAPIAGVLLYKPDQVLKWHELEWDPGWWISAALKDTKPDDRLVVYQTEEDQGIAGVFDVASQSFWGDELGYAAYGRPTPMASPIPRQALLHDP